jgi:hypothetical protein
MNSRKFKEMKKIKKIKRRIYKSSGQSEYFSAKKLQSSIERAGLEARESKEITKEISQIIKPGASTRDIFKNAIKLVKQKSTTAAIHYSLKKALTDLGPTGYEFENFVSKYFETLGYTTYLDTILQGQFVRHEVDVIASRPNYNIYVECKFHNNNQKNDIKTVLYIKARWDDLKNGPDGKYLREYFIVSNSSFTTDAIDYAKGVGLKLLGVNAPENFSFLDEIKRYKLYPITSLRRLKKSHLDQLLKKRLVLCKDLLHERRFLLRLGMTYSEIDLLFNDIKKIIGETTNEY